jgi:hypothetical protein
MANQFRDEMEITVGEDTFLLRPSFEGLLEIEDKAKAGLLELMQQISSGKITARHTVAIIYGGIVGAGGKITFDELGQKCLEHGMAEISGKAAMFLAKIVSARQKKTNPKESK